MPTIRERLQDDWKNALKAKDKFKANVISTAKSAILLVQKQDPSKEVTDDIVIEILAKEVKQRREAVLEFEKGNRQDLVESTNEEIKILLEYLPQQLSEEEIKQIIEDSAIEAGASSIKDMGKVMGAANKALSGKAEGRIIAQKVKDLLNQMS